MKKLGLALVLGAIVSSAPSAEAGGGWAWANKASSSSRYKAPSAYSFNSGGGSIWIDREGTGLYRVTFDGLVPPSDIGGNAQVVAYGSGRGYCNVRMWTGNEVFVGCYSATGQLANSTFVVALTHVPSGSSIAGDAGYLWSASASGGDVPSFWSWSAAGEANTVQRSDVGYYFVFLEGISSFGAVVTAYDPNQEGLYCTGAAFPDTIREGRTRAAVTCFDKQGDPTDARFSLTVGQVYTFESNGHAYGQARFVEPPTEFPSPWIPHSFSKVSLEFAPFPDEVLVRLTSGVELTARVPILPPSDKSIAFVTAYPSINGMRCKIRSWFAVEGGSTDVNFHCSDKDGQAFPHVGWTVVYATLQPVE
jgi:hypothetical protein